MACGNAKTNSTDSETTIEATTDQTPTVKTLDQKDLASKMEDKNVVVIDVRTPGEVASGYIKGTHKFLNINDSNFETSINELDKSKTYIMYCRSGARSGRAAGFMISNGFTDVYNLEGGILNYTGDIAK
ncbi:MAG: rhodanese-like domain-containing protein [Bacteroidia bacterium]|nr:rhodanese-like domain-containing protein [Bacteroidia bacterium]